MSATRCGCTPVHCRRSAVSVAHYAGVAAAACLQHGDINGAGLAVQAGFNLEPASPGLAYLGRLVQHESAPNPGTPAR